jgi:uncharacterized protein (TIGR02996 family)
MIEVAFFQAILEQPADDVPRLAFADWLMEQDDPEHVARGEFIQVQCQLARRAEAGENWIAWSDITRRLPHLLQREEVLLHQYGAIWSRAVSKFVDRVVFRRGFIDEVTLSGMSFLQVAEELFRLAPLRSVRLTGSIWPFRTLANCPELAQVEALDLSRLYIGDAGLRTLLASPHLARLTSLNLRECYLTDRGIQALAASPLLARLTHLDLAANAFTITGVRALLDSPHWGHLRHLNLAHNPRVGERGLQTLASSLAGSLDPAILQLVLQMCSSGEQDYSNAAVRELAQRAGFEAETAVPILLEGLGDSRRKVRSAAGQMLARLGSRAAPALPGLIQRLHERTPSVRAHLAPALARLLPTLPQELQQWLCLLANPLRSPGENLKSALENEGLPESLGRSFAEICQRRLAWRNQLLNRTEEPLPSPTARLDRRSLWPLAQQVSNLAGQFAVRHLCDPSHQPAPRQKAQNKEYAWLLARLCELIQKGPPEHGT